jgi:hypothetical protein
MELEVLVVLEHGFLYNMGLIIDNLVRLPQNVINPDIQDQGFPDDAPTEWRVTCHNPGAETVEVGAFAQCATLVDAP